MPFFSTYFAKPTMNHCKNRLLTWIYSVFFTLPIAVKTPKDKVTCDYIGIFTQNWKFEHVFLKTGDFEIKQEDGRQPLKTGVSRSKREGWNICNRNHELYNWVIALSNRLLEGCSFCLKHKTFLSYTSKILYFFQKFLVVNFDVDVGFNSDKYIFPNILLLKLVLRYLRVKNRTIFMLH